MTGITRSGAHLSVFAILGLTHLLNDPLQSLIPAAYFPPHMADRWLDRL